MSTEIATIPDATRPDLAVEVYTSCGHVVVLIVGEGRKVRLTRETVPQFIAALEEALLYA